MFDDVGHKFYVDEHKFKDGGHKFHAVEHKIYRRKKSFVGQTENKSRTERKQKQGREKTKVAKRKNYNSEGKI